MTTLPQQPNDLNARLAAAGATDEASLRAALQRDPQLKADFDAFLSSPEYQSAQMNALFEAFVAVQDPDQMREFWQSVPGELEQPFIAAVEALIQQAQAQGNTGAVEDLRAKLADFGRMCEETQAAQQVPPILKALTAFANAPDEAAARAVFAHSVAQLQPYEAQQILDQNAQQSEDADFRQRLAGRAALLRQLRGGAAQPIAPAPDLSGLEQATFDNRQMQVAGNLFQAHEINITNVVTLERRWVRPAPPSLTKELVERSADIEAVIAKIRAQGAVAISSISSPNAVAMQGMPGVGKTALARLLALRLDPAYPDGVLWADIGPGVQKREDATAILTSWAGYFVGGIQDRALSFTPEAVRALMAEHPRVLVILDNVWSLDAIRPLREALPREAHLILTTRSLEIMRQSGGETYTVGLLGDADALALVALRLKWRPEDNSSDAAWVNDLIQRLGYHPLALDITLGLMGSEGFGPGDWRGTALRVIGQVKTGTGFQNLKLPDEVDADANVAAALFVSYLTLDEAAQLRFRALGAFASEADFTTALAAAVWNCDEATARAQLTAFVQRALLERRADGVWRQHAILRGYALALLRNAGEQDALATRHAAACDDAMRAADDAQRYFEMLPAHDQLAHAFAWAIENDLDRALGLIGNSANLQAQFGKAQDNFDWSQRALAVARVRGMPADVARAQGTLANALSRVATLPGEDRRTRLLDALAAYDAALQFRRPDTAPLAYAMTQNNRANLLSDLATLPGEDRRTRLLDALAAYDAALQHYRPDTAPLDYAMTQNNRANLLRDLATLPGEDRRTRLLDALAAYDAALQHYRPDTAPLAYAMTQNNRAVLLSDLATLPGEDRRTRLLDALAAYDAALQFRRPDTAPLDYAMTQNNRANLLSDLATLPGEDRRTRLLDALAAYDAALQHYRPDTAPLDYAMTQNNRANLLSDLATLPGEDRRTRLLDALAAYDAALQHYRPDTAPLDYAMTQNNRANLLSDLATLPGEDRRTRLLDALAAYDAALQFRRPDTAPLAYAMTQNNRANLLSDLATLPGEDRRTRLLDALAAYDAALQHYRPDTAPLDYAMTQNNRANLLRDLATLPGEDRRTRLLDALAAYDAALQFRRPDTAPLAYAMTQNNRAVLLRDLATLPGEDRRTRLLDALAAYDAALQHYRPDTAPLDYAMTQNNRANLLRDLATLPGEDRRTRLLDALAAYDAALQHYRPDTAPLDYAMTQNNRANLLSDLATLPGEDRRTRLLDALRCAAEAVSLFEKYQQAQYLETGLRVLRDLRDACGDDFGALWAEAGLGVPPDWLAREPIPEPENPMQAALAMYLEHCEQARLAEADPAAWQRAADAGEGMLSVLGAAGVLGEQVDALKADIASTYNMLGNALAAGDKRAALAAFERATALQPDFAMWQRNRAGTLIELRELDEAARAIARARALEPDAARLAELDAELVKAKESDS